MERTLYGIHILFWKIQCILKKILVMALYQIISKIYNKSHIVSKIIQPEKLKPFNIR